MSSSMEGTMSWTDERVEMLKKLWADGLSASQIAAELGGITRNAVIGKVHRLGLSGRAKAPSSAGPRPRKTRAPSHVFRSIRNAMRGNTALAAQAVAAYEAEIEPEPERLERVIALGPRGARRPGGRGLRGGDRARARAARERHPDRRALLDPGAERRQVPLADRRSRPRGLLLLRRQGDHRPALLRLPRHYRLSPRERA